MFRSSALLFFLALIVPGVVLAQPGAMRDLSVTVSSLPDTVSVGDTVWIHAHIHNDGPGAFPILPGAPVLFAQAVPSAQYGSLARKPDFTEFRKGGATVIASGDSLGVDLPIVIQPVSTNATGGGGGIDIVIIIWPARAYDPDDPNHDNNLYEESIYVKDYSLNAFTTALSDQDLLPGMIIFPNPASTELSIRFEEPFTGSLSIHDLTGRPVVQQDASQSREMRLPVDHLPAGWYAVRLITDKGAQSRSLMIRE